MSQLGLGVMIGMLSGNSETVAAIRASQGKKIVGISLDKDQETPDGFERQDLIRIDLTEHVLLLWDGGQSCCEARYTTTDDAVEEFVGATLVDVDLLDADTIEDDYGVHEQQFLRVQTDRGDMTFVTHNEHNGYYGGFLLKAALEPAGS